MKYDANASATRSSVNLRAWSSEGLIAARTCAEEISARAVGHQPRSLVAAEMEVGSAVEEMHAHHIQSRRLACEASSASSRRAAAAWWTRAAGGGGTKLGGRRARARGSANGERWVLGIARMSAKGEDRVSAETGMVRFRWDAVW